MNGINWNKVDEGSTFAANNDGDSKKDVIFQTPVLARTIRIYPQTWSDNPSMRFDAIYLDL